MRLFTSVTVKKETPQSSVVAETEKLSDKYSRLTEKLSSVVVYLGKAEQEKKNSIQEKDRLIHRIQQLELEIRNNLEVGNDLINQNTEYSTLINKKFKRWPSSRN